MIFSGTELEGSLLLSHLEERAGLLCLWIDRKMDSVVGQEHQRTSSKYTNRKGQSVAAHTCACTPERWAERLTERRGRKWKKYYTSSVNILKQVVLGQAVISADSNLRYICVLRLYLPHRVHALWIFSGNLSMQATVYIFLCKVSGL